MTGKTHQLLGITTGLAVYLNRAPDSFNPATTGFVLIACYFAALLPDLDRSSAKIWDSLPFGHQAGKIVDPFIKHRNFSHSLVGILLFGLLFSILLNHFPSYWGVQENLVLICALVSYGSHIISDMITCEGVPLLFPLKRMMGFPPRPLQGIRIETGKWFENLVFFPLLNIILLAIILSNWQLIKNLIFK